MNHFVLTNFSSYYLTPPIPQQETIDSAIWMIAQAIAVKNNLKSTVEINNVFESVCQKVNYFGVKPKYIHQRRLYFAAKPTRSLKNISFLNEDGKFNTSGWQSFFYQDLFKKQIKPDGETIEFRLDAFDKVVTGLVEEIYSDVERSPDDIIHVTCAGYVSPSPLKKLVSGKNWSNTVVTHSYHMGCYGAIPAIRMATGFLASSNQLRRIPKNCIDIVHTELLSTHACSTDDSAETIISKTLFADGFIRYQLCEQSIVKSGTVGLKVLTLDESILPNSTDDMTWKIKDHQFKMTLGIAVPGHIKNNIVPFIKKLCRNINVTYDERSKDDFIFAIHPGGPKIIDSIAGQLHLTEYQVANSRKVLFENGNMSSVTIPTILERIINDDSILPGKKIIVLAFGPGLTAAGAILEKTVC